MIIMTNIIAIYIYIYIYNSYTSYDDCNSYYPHPEGEQYEHKLRGRM